MSYHIIETPDHLHRGLHLFVVRNLATLLDLLACDETGRCYELSQVHDERAQWYLRDLTARLALR